MDNDNESGEPRERVTLILREKRFEVEKQKLIDKSHYFAALLSTNYIEYGQTEHVINYDISATLLQNFIHWIHDDKVPFMCATRYDREEFDRHLILLELSVLFAADSLTDYVSDALERHFMLPEYAIDIWLLAQEFNFKVLRDLSLAACLDRFDELPLNSTNALSRENFLKLLGNNVRTTTPYWRQVRHEWMNHNNDFTIVDTLRNNGNKTLHSIITYESNDQQFIHCWDGDDFFELASFEYPTDIVERSSSLSKRLEGVQIIGRRYDLYLCGGEYGIGSGKFNQSIWRYSLISKKWFLETNMPIARRHMITVFIENKLLLVGGVGRYRQKLQSVDVYDIYTGTWTSGGDMKSLQFTSVPAHFVFNDELIIYQFMPTIYVYFSKKEVWETRFCKDCLMFNLPKDMPMLTLKTVPCYIDVIDRNEMVLRAITDTCDVQNCNYTIKPLSAPGNFRESYVLSFYLKPFYLIPLSYNRDTKLLIWTEFKTLDRHRNLRKTLHLHSIPIRNPRKFHSLTITPNKKFSSRKFFQLLHPANLHAT